MRLHDIFGMARPWTIVYGVKKWNWLKKIMQVEVDVKCMCTKFDGHGLSGFGDLAPFCFPSNFPFRPWTKNRIGS